METIVLKSTSVGNCFDQDQILLFNAVKDKFQPYYKSTLFLSNDIFDIYAFPHYSEWLSDRLIMKRVNFLYWWTNFCNRKFIRKK